MKFELMRETNAAVARALPCTVWHVVVATPDMSRVSANLAGNGFPPVKDMEMHRTFLTTEAANAEAESIHEGLKADAGTTAQGERKNNGDLFVGFFNPGGRGMDGLRLVEVRRDDGHIQ